MQHTKFQYECETQNKSMTQNKFDVRVRSCHTLGGDLRTGTIFYFNMILTCSVPVFKI